MNPGDLIRDDRTGDILRLVRKVESRGGYKGRTLSTYRIILSAEGQVGGRVDLYSFFEAQYEKNHGQRYFPITEMEVIAWVAQ